MFSKKVDISLEEISKIFGALDENAAFIEKEFDVALKLTGEEFVIKGEDENVENALLLISKLKKATSVDKNRIRLYIDMIKSGNASEIESLNSDVVAITARGKQIVCKTLGQRAYVKAIRRNTVVFGIGPAGTGKTYLAVALAVMAYKSGEIDKIILKK